MWSWLKRLDAALDRLCADYERAADGARGDAAGPFTRRRDEIMAAWDATAF